MSEAIDRSNVVIHPPIAWAIAFVVGLGVNWLYPLPFVTSLPRAWVGGFVFAVGFALGIWRL
jgi:hypothetical protein